MMPARVIRDGILDSDRYWSCTIEARQTFMHLLLLADDLGMVNIAPTFIRRRCFDDRPDDTKIARLLCELSDADLIRVYEHNGARYAFIPRFQQRVRFKKAKHPIPPRELYADDEDASAKIASLEVRDTESREINDLGRNVSDICRTTVRTVRPEVEEKRREEKKNKSAASYVATRSLGAGMDGGDSSAASAEPAIVSLPLVDGSEFRFTEAYAEELRPAFPAVDVRQQAHQMRAWLESNPRNRKTHRGIGRFVFRWLERAQNSASRGGTRSDATARDDMFAGAK